MSIHRLNHAVRYVGDLDASVTFYAEVLGFTVAESIPGQAAFLRAADSSNDHDLGLFRVGPDARSSEAGRGAMGLYHLAWEVGTLGDLVTLQGERAAGALRGMSDHGTTKSLSGADPTAGSSRWLIQPICEAARR